MLGSTPAGAQDTNGQDADEEGSAAVWRLADLRKGFCVQFLVEPGKLSRRLPEGSRLLPAGQVGELTPALKTVVEGQPEFAAWTPSHLCLFYLSEVNAAGRQVRDRNPSKAPVLGLWTVAAGGAAAGSRRDVALEVFTNSGTLEDAGRAAGLEIDRIRSSVGKVPPDDEGVSSGADRYEFRIGKAQLVWDGMPGADSAPPEAPLARQWQAPGRRGGWFRGSHSLSAEWTRAMIGSLKVEGDDELARLLKASPIRFVGPVYQGGAGSFQFGR